MDDSWMRKKLPHSDHLTAHPTVVSLPYSGQLTLQWSAYPTMVSLPYSGQLTLQWSAYPKVVIEIKDHQNPSHEPLMNKRGNSSPFQYVSW